jgi:hypothetical protein
MRTYKKSSNLILLSLGLGCSCVIGAEFEPIELTSGSYNHDLVVEKTAPPPAVMVTTASMDQGVINSGFTWFERGYLPEWPATGVPEAGFLLTSDLLADHQYRMPPSYHLRNAFLIDSTRATALITFVTPTNYGALSFLTSSGVGRNLIQYEVNHSDGSVESGLFTSPNWYSDGDPAWSANGRVNVTSFIRADLNSYNPRLYSVDIRMSNPASPISTVELSLADGSGHTAVFAVSGAALPGEPFVPIEITGYNEDLVVEASAVKPGFMETNTTATMEGGTANVLFTWYERGYNPAAPDTGLPAPGSLLTNTATGTHFLMPPSYSLPNAVLIDSVCSNSTLIPLRPGCYSAVSFLTASASGPSTNQCILNHANGKSETNTFVSLDWLGVSLPAFTAYGRVSVSTKLIDRASSNSPQLYAVEIPITITNSPVTKFRLAQISRSINTHTVIFALAGIPAPPLHRPTLSISFNPNGQLTVRSTQAGKLQSCNSLSESVTHWTDLGPISQALTLVPLAGKPAQFYRVVAQEL